MLNYIAAGVTWWLVTGPLQAESSKTSGIPQTELIPEEARVGAVAGIPVGFLIALALAIACWWMLSRTTLGFQLNTVGANKHAARYAGISINRIIALSMVIGGGLAGLAGALEAQGTLHRFEPAIGGTLGFDGITIALLARANPLATIPAAFLVGVLRTGAPGSAVRDRHRARGRRPAPRGHPAHGLHPGARQVDLPQPRRQGHRRLDELGELT